MKILVIAPHPDDEVLGCGGTIKKYTKKGDEVYLCIVTKAYAPDWSEEFIAERSKETAEANRILGIKKTYFLDFLAAKLDTVMQKELNKAISEVIKEVSPQIIYIPNKDDLHNDHRVVFQSSLIATRPVCGSCIEKILSYEVLSETDWGNSDNVFKPNTYVDVSQTLDEKIDAMKAYKSEIKDYPHPRSLDGIRILAQKRGMECGIKSAEAFILLRETVK